MVLMRTLTTKRLLYGTQHVVELLPWLLHCINLNLKANDDDSKVKLGIADEFSIRHRYKSDRKRRFLGYYLPFASSISSFHLNPQSLFSLK